MNPLRRKTLIALVGMLGASGAIVAGKPTRKANEFGADLQLDTMFPATFGDWQIDRSITPVLPNPQLQKVIEATYDQTLARTYINARGERIMLSVAYAGREHEDMNTHRPEVCYPAQGMSVRKSTWRTELDVAGTRLPLHRLVTGNGARNEPISYWLVVGRQVTDFGMQQRWVTIKYGLTGRIPDGMLVRISSIDEDDQRAFALQDRFTREMLQALAPIHRQRLLGALS